MRVDIAVRLLAEGHQEPRKFVNRFHATAWTRDFFCDGLGSPFPTWSEAYVRCYVSSSLGYTALTAK